MKKQSRLNASPCGFVSGSQGYYTTSWKTQLVEAVDGLLQSDPSLAEACQRIAAYGLQTGRFTLSVDEVQCLYFVFKQELAVVDEWKKTLRRSPGPGSGIVRYQETIKEPITSDKQIRNNRAILEAESRLKSLNATEDATTTLQEIVQSLPFLSKQEKERVAMLSSAVAQKLGTIASRETHKILREAWEQHDNLPALGAALGQDTPEEWALRGLHEAKKRGINVPTKGRGQPRTTSDEEKRSQVNNRQRKRRKGLQEAAEQLKKDLEKIKNEVRHSRCSSQNRQAEITKKFIHFLEAVIRNDTDRYRRSVADKTLRQLQRKSKSKK